MVGLIAAVLGSVVASAPVKEVKLPPTPVVFDAICETETNVVQSVWFEGVREVSVRIDVKGTERNALRVALGKDGDKDGRLERHEGALEFGWDAGDWMIRDLDGMRYDEKASVKDGDRVLVCTWKLAEDGKVVAFSATADGAAVFADLSSHPKRVPFEKTWSMVRIQRNGVDDPKECVRLMWQK